MIVLICSALGKKIHMVTAGVIIEKDGKFLLVQEKMPIPGIYRNRNLPMGRRKGKKEKPPQNAEREGEEETGFELAVGYHVGDYTVAIGPMVMITHIFQADIIGGELRIPSDLLDVDWFSFEDIKWFKEAGELVHPYVLEAIADYRKEKTARQGLFP